MEESQEVEQKDSRPWLYKKGQSGNPAGRPKGSVSLKVYVRNKLLSMTDEEREEYLEGVDKKIIWEMAEGKAKQDIQHEGTLTISEVINKLKNGRTVEQGMAIELPVQDTGQNEEVDTIPAQSSSKALQSPQVVEKYNPEE